jgi:hypothetical protein
MKAIWLSFLISSEDKIKNLISQPQTYGLGSMGILEKRRSIRWCGQRPERN